jgi:hypothetical protein
MPQNPMTLKHMLISAEWNLTRRFQKEMFEQKKTSTFDLHYRRLRGIAQKACLCSKPLVKRFSSGEIQTLESAKLVR